MGSLPFLASRFRAGLEEASISRIPAGGFILTEFSYSGWSDPKLGKAPAYLEE